MQMKINIDNDHVTRKQLNGSFEACLLIFKVCLTHCEKENALECKNIALEFCLSRARLLNVQKICQVCSSAG